MHRGEVFKSSIPFVTSPEVKLSATETHNWPHSLTTIQLEKTLAMALFFSFFYITT